MRLRRSNVFLWAALVMILSVTIYIDGTGTSFNQFWKGDIAEMIVYARVLSDAERAKVEDYLAKKYGVTLAR
jgi:hypothetical protein